MLRDFFGINSLAKVLDFLLENRFWEYTKKDIAENSGISRVQIYRIWPILKKYAIIKESRRIGATSLYMTNLESPILKELESLSMEIARFLSESIADEELEKLKRKSPSDPESLLKSSLHKR